MARRRHKLARAPIVEAVIELRISPATQQTQPDWDHAHAVLGPDYGPGKPLRSIEATFSTEDAEIRQTRSEVGLLFRSTDGRRVVQFRENGFAFNQLEPYSDWPTVFDEAMRLWRVYRALRRDLRVTRLAVRYINRMMLANGTSLSDYLTTPPTLPAEVPQHLREYLMRAVIQDVDRSLSAVLMQALEPGPEKGTGAILLDVDAFRELQFGLDPDDAEINRVFGELRDLKNEIFFACITEAAAERFDDDSIANR